MYSNIEKSLDNEEESQNLEILTTDWFEGTLEPQYIGLYQYTKPCHNFWDFPRRPLGMIRWNGHKEGWSSEKGEKIDFNPATDFWRGSFKPLDAI